MLILLYIIPQRKIKKARYILSVHKNCSSMHLADYLPLLTIFHLLCTEKYKISYKCRLSTHSFIQVMQAHLTSSADNHDTLTEMLIGKK